MTVEVALLGPLECRVDGEPVPVGGPRQRTLLGLLALESGRVVSADRLAEAVWGDEAVARDRTTLQVHVSNLRRVLGPEGHEVIVTRDPGYLLDPGAAQVDLDRVRALLGEGRHREALAVWRGELLVDLDDVEAFRVPRSQWAEMRLTTLEDAIDDELAAGGHAALVGELTRLTGEQPYRERLWGQLMLALYRSGRQAEALHAFARARRVLVEEVGIDPGPALQRLERSILLQSPSIEFVPALGPAVHWLGPDGGAHRCPLGEAEVLIGRGEHCHVTIEGDGTVSRHHATIVPAAHGWAVRDEGSRNGTYLDGERVVGLQDLYDGDLVRCGQTVLLVGTGGGVARVAPTNADPRTRSLQF